MPQLHLSANEAVRPGESLREWRRLSRNDGSLATLQPPQQPSDLGVRIGSELSLGAPDVILEQPHRGHRIPVEQRPLGERVDRVGTERVNVAERCRETVCIRQVAWGPRRLERRSEGISCLSLETDPRPVHPMGEFGASTLVEPPQRLCHTYGSDLTLAQGGQVRRQLGE